MGTSATSLTRRLIVLRVRTIETGPYRDDPGGSWFFERVRKPDATGREAAIRARNRAVSRELGLALQLLAPLGDPQEYDMMYDMLERVTATIDRETLAKIRRLAGPRGVSAFLNAAAKQALARREILALLDELDATHGRPTKAQRDTIDRDMRKIFGR